MSAEKVGWQYPADIPELTSHIIHLMNPLILLMRILQMGAFKDSSKPPKASNLISLGHLAWSAMYLLSVLLYQSSLGRQKWIPMNLKNCSSLTASTSHASLGVPNHENEN